MDAEDPLARLEAERAEPRPRAALDAELTALGVALDEAAQLVVRHIDPMTDAFLSGDALTAQQLIAADAEVDAACAQLEERCLLLLARQAPVATDLRRVVAVLRCTMNVARSGDLLRHVGEALTWVHPPAFPEDVRHVIRQLAEVSADILARGAAAWREGDSLAANELEDDDDQVDLLQKVLLTELYAEKVSVEEAVSLALIARYYERIADHGVELARQVAFALTGDLPPS